jgi:hypothetical protein
MVLRCRFPHVLSCLDLGVVDVPVRVSSGCGLWASWRSSPASAHLHRFSHQSCHIMPLLLARLYYARFHHGCCVVWGGVSSKRTHP